MPVSVNPKSNQSVTFDARARPVGVSLRQLPGKPGVAHKRSSTKNSYRASPTRWRSGRENGLRNTSALRVIHHLTPTLTAGLRSRNIRTRRRDEDGHDPRLDGDLNTPGTSSSIASQTNSSRHRISERLVSMETYAWSAAAGGGITLLSLIGGRRGPMEASKPRPSMFANGSGVVFGTLYWLALPLILSLYGWRKTLKVYLLCIGLTMLISWPLARGLGIGNGGLVQSLAAGLLLAPFTSVLPRAFCGYLLAQKHATWRNRRTKTSVEANGKMA